MSNEIQLANAATPTDVISTALGKALKNKIVFMPFTYGEDLPANTMVKLLRKDAAYGLGAVVNELGNAFNSTFSQSTITATVVKTVITSQITVEARDFGGMSDRMILDKQSNSLQRTLDGNIKTLFQGASQEVDAGTQMTIEAILEAAYLVDAGNAGTDGKNLICGISKKHAFQIKKQLMQTNGSAWSNLQLLSILTNMTSPNGFIGSLPGVDCYHANSLATGGGDTSGAVFNPELAFFSMYSPSINVERDNPNATGLFTELTSWLYNIVVEWYDSAVVEVKADS